jgi:processive 1,2-diacylglycerol beta-glucosyltransferase
LLVSASIGTGHTQAARAIQAAWNSRFPGDFVTIVDFMDERNSCLNHAIKETYLKMIEATPFLYDALYHMSQGLRPGSRSQNLLSWFMKQTMLRMLAKHQPDTVICTHPFPCAAMAYLKRFRRVGIPLAGVITDFTVHSTWVYPEVDSYVVAAEEMRDDLLKHKIAADRVTITGIPIQPPAVSPAEPIYEMLGLKCDLPIVLLMGGGLGLGPLEDIAIALDSVSSPIQIVVVTGKNSHLQHDLSLSVKQLRHSATVLGYTPLVRDLMGVARLLITKPGALTLSEAMAAGLPVLLYESFPGQEADNASFLIAQGAANWFRSEQPAVIAQLLINSVERAQMLKAIGRIARPDSAWAAAEAIAGRIEPANQLSGM